MHHHHNHAQNHDHQHDHSTHQHAHHDHGRNAPLRTLLWAIGLTLAFAVIEAITGWFSKSLTLLGDAGHMGSDSAALAISAFAAWLVRKPPSERHSYGYGRAEVLAAWASSLIMLLISVGIIVEAVRRLHAPQDVSGLPMIGVASMGIVLNLFLAWWLARGERTINIRAALLHIIGDLLGSITALVAGAVIYFTGWMPIDPILSIFISILIMISSASLLLESMSILMEGVPKHIRPQSVTQDLLSVPFVKAIHDLHIWTLSSGRTALSAHVNVHPLSEWSNTLHEIKAVLKKEYEIEHVTLQPEAELIDCKPCR